MGYIKLVANLILELMRGVMPATSRGTFIREFYQQTSVNRLVVTGF